MYEKSHDFEKLARLYAIYIARGKLAEDARYVDRLRWMLSETGQDDEIDAFLKELLQEIFNQLMARPRLSDGDDRHNNAYENVCFANTARMRRSAHISMPSSRWVTKSDLKRQSPADRERWRATAMQCPFV